MPGLSHGRAGRPGSKLVTKDVLILDFGTDRAPSRLEREPNTTLGARLERAIIRTARESNFRV